LSVDYMVNVVPVVASPASLSFLLPMLAMALVLVASLFVAFRSPAALFGLLAAGGSYLLVSNVFFASPIIMAERMMYLSMAGIAALVAASLAFVVDLAVRRSRRKAAVVVLAALVLAPLGARSFLRTADWKSDLTLFSSAVSATPRSAQSWHNLAHQHLDRKEYEEALGAIDRALELHPGFLQARLTRLAIQRRTGHLAEAERSARQVIGRWPQSGDAKFELIRILTLRAGGLEARGETAEGRQLREEALAMARSALSEEAARDLPGARAVLQQVAAENLVELGRNAEAERAYLDAVAAAEEESGAVGEAVEGVRAVTRAAAAEFFRKSGRPLEAAGHFAAAAEAAERAGQTATAATLLMDAAEQSLAAGDPAAALESYDRLLEIDQESERGRHGRARARLASGDAAGAEDDLQVLLAGEPRGRKAAAIWTDLAISSAMAGNYQEANDRFGRALEADPGQAEAWYRRALIRIRLGRVREAESDLLSAIEAGLPSAVAAGAWFELARLAEQRGDAAAARERLERCLSIMPGHAGAKSLLASLSR
jgi:tetratricopeptide (TPR) repeat protein